MLTVSTNTWALIDLLYYSRSIVVFYSMACPGLISIFNLPKLGLSLIR